jgi:hypothetical protein
MKYQSGAAFRRALEDHFRSSSLKAGIPLIRLRKMAAFDRFLSRLVLNNPDEWVLKGGYALQLRLGERARTTKDIDVLVLANQENVLSMLRSAGKLDLGDWFQFEVRESLEFTPDEFGGLRYQVQAFLDSRIFEEFHIDVGMSDPIIGSIEYLKAPALLDFAHIKAVVFPCYPVNQQIAEKVHAYTRPHPSGESSRVKDLVDILVLASLGKIDGENIFQALKATFKSRASHSLPEKLPHPPRGWSRVYQKLAHEVSLRFATLEEGGEAIKAFLDPVLSGEASGVWDSIDWCWL